MNTRGDIAFYLGENLAHKVCLGNEVVWEQKYLTVEPQYLWLTESNNFTDDVDILSNVVWNVN